ncbi:MAG: PHB depolymerase family esterase [Pseudomonadota bacterium]|nr:PHB depolymerase family esterase [Pseudomonadota bacterium]
MNAINRQAMAEAARLTNEGRLEEATAVLLGTRKQASPASPAPHMPKPAGAAVLRDLLGRVAKVPLARGLKRPQPGIRTPEVLPQGARFEERQFSNAAGSRNYKLYVPSRSANAPIEPLPLVVMLHGCTQTPDDFAAGTGMNALAEELKFLVVYPAQDTSANPQRCWNWFNANDQQRDRGEPSLIAGITCQVMDEFATDRARVYVAGLSAGGAAAAIMGAVYPELYAAIGVHSGLAYGAARDMPSAFSAMRQGSAPTASAAVGTLPVATIVFHGDRDGTVSAVNGEQVIAQSKAAAQLHSSVSHGRSAGGVEYTRTVQADDTGLVVLEHWLLHGGGHAWSGGSAAGSYTDPRGPDASREMLRFFLQHRSGQMRS